MIFLIIAGIAFGIAGISFFLLLIDWLMPRRKYGRLLQRRAVESSGELDGSSTRELYQRIRRAHRMDEGSDTRSQGIEKEENAEQQLEG